MSGKTVKKFKATTNSKHNESILPNLLNRNFKLKDWFGTLIAVVSMRRKNIALCSNNITSNNKGDCWDNAVKTELVFHERYKTREQAKTSIFEYIEIFYNRKRRHSAKNLMSPANFEIFRKVA